MARHASNTPDEADEADYPNETDYPDADKYDPDQPITERREIQRGMRDLISKTNENYAEFLEAKPAIFGDIMTQSTRLMDRSKQTMEAAIDAKLILHISELSYKRSVRWASGNAASGIDVDEFVSKCITYMRRGRGNADDEAADEAGDEGDMLDWAHLGRYACIPHSRRPPVPGFLLGPLSVEKKARNIGPRAPRLRINNLREVRPEVLRPEDLRKSEKTDLPALCAKIFRQLKAISLKAQVQVQAEFDAGGQQADGEEMRLMLYKHGLRSNGRVDFYKFVVNPHSFGQTVENIFYVSFLIRDGKVGIVYDDDKFPTLCKCQIRRFP